MASPEVSFLNYKNEVKPKLRGISHLIAFIFSFYFGYSLIYSIPSQAFEERISLIIYALSISILFGSSSLLHVPHHKDQKIIELLRKVDHSCIYLLIAGTYTPYITISSKDRALFILSIVWLIAFIGISLKFIKFDIPSYISIIPYISLGWCCMVFFSPFELINILTYTGSAILLLAGICYTIGAVIYAKRYPNTYPKT
eukprot:TRINITY_DN971_c0_g1_i1.p1 TRINITY_DN971_c0_g1~~TRINITY_DN971_c0_g1_i1.p1  ORF type:complete len:199 (+),score=6.80 TRINITY_DN971_c0_g1_i1:203-799(+)